MNKMELYVKICERAEKLGFKGERLSLLMDIESADLKFDIRLEELLNADDSDFVHDISGIINNVDRDIFPATDFGLFIPRFASKIISRTK